MFKPATRADAVIDAMLAPFYTTRDIRGEMLTFIPRFIARHVAAHFHTQAMERTAIMFGGFYELPEDDELL